VFLIILHSQFSIINFWLPLRSIEQQPKVVGTLRCAVLKVESVVHRSLADGTAECAYYYAGQPTNRTATRVPIARGLLLAWELTTNRTAELPAGHRG